MENGGSNSQLEKIVQFDFLETCNTDDVFHAMVSWNLCFAHPLNMTSTKHAVGFCNKVLRRHCVHDELVFKGIFIAGLHNSIWHSMHSYWSSRKNATVHDLALQVASLTDVQYRWRSANTAHTTAEQKTGCGNMNDRWSSTLSTAGAPVNQSSTTLSFTQ